MCLAGYNLRINLPSNSYPREFAAPGAWATRLERATIAKHTPKPKRKQIIANGGEFVASALDMLDLTESVQAELFDFYDASKPRYGGSSKRGVNWLEYQGRSFVYFVAERGTSFVKIGFSSSLKQRISNIDGANPRGIEVLAVISGDAATERELHGRFVQYHIRKEWYELRGSLAEYILAVQRSEINVWKIGRAGRKLRTIFDKE